MYIQLTSLSYALIFVFFRKRHEELINKLDKQQESQKEVLQKLQSQYQQMQQKTMKAQ